MAELCNLSLADAEDSERSFLGMKQKRFTKEFEEETVRLYRTSGRTRRDIAEDLGIGLSTLTRWLSRSREREIDEPDRRPPGEDVVAELKRLRRENEILRQERGIS